MKHSQRVLLFVVSAVFILRFFITKQSKTSSAFMQGIRLNTHLKPNEDNFYQLQSIPVTNTNYSYILEPRNLCSENTKIVFFSPSPVSHAASRDVTRVTWASVMREPRWPFMQHSLPEMKLIFAVAQNTDNNSIDDLKKESETHNDILYMEFHDTYRNLTLKSLLSLRWMSRHCSSASFFVKVDEDQFVFVPQLLLELRHFHNRVNLIIGSYNDHSEALHNRQGKWGVPQEVFPFDAFPPYVSGPMYAMTSDVASVVSISAPYVFPVHLEDVFITGIIPKVMHIQHAVLGSFGNVPSIKPSACSMTLFELVAMDVKNNSGKLELWQDFLEANKTASKLCLRETERRSRVRWNHNGSDTL